MASKDATPQEILQEQLPDYFKPVLDYQEIVKMFGSAFATALSNAAQISANIYIQTADEPTIAWWESVLGLETQFGDTLDFRRSRVLQKISQIVPFSIGFLNANLTLLFGSNYLLQVDPVACTLDVQVTSDRYGAVNLLYDLLWDVVPAHLKINANQQITNIIGGQRFYGGTCISNAFAQTLEG